MPFEFTRLEIPEVVLISPRVFEDSRGFFMETYKHTDFAGAGINDRFLQDNHSRSFEKGTLRGLHYQAEPRSQAKLIRVVRGSIFDVAVDIRPGSPACGRWVSAVLTDRGKEMLYIPRGFAHGFCTLEEDTEVIYKCSDVYSPEHERGIIWDDAAMSIEWPVEDPTLSERDSCWPGLEEACAGAGRETRP
ncbi:MAG: dTDP-4-dehydrorhamnose 3,5-epimerase [Candidatus Omnitrophica bacterium]|nr:dTDP-4-dehydrorhamnose 3,5-epimerase [Candidatus Omnitrophota bacterium]